MKFLMLIKHSEAYQGRPVPQGLLDGMGRFIEEGFKSGVLKETAGLKPTVEGLRVRQAGGALRVTDGPFSEAKEVVGGYAMVEASSRAHAREIATKFMQLHLEHWPEFEGECEVREVQSA